jgi:uncharacterized protein (TIGR02466 family)
VQPIDPAFPVPILNVDLDNCAELNAKLRRVIDKYFDSVDKKRVLSHEWNRQLITKDRAKLGYTSFNCETLTMKKEFAFFFQSLSPLITQFFNALQFHGRWEFVNAWSSVYPKGAWVPSHNHGDAHWSGVYYVATSEACGDLVFWDPKEYALANEPSGFMFRGNHHIKVTPVDGKLCVFPGYLKHETLPNQSEHDRIIISFNIRAFPRAVAGRN